MTGSTAVTPLVPRGKSSKKKRPGFRPVGKSKGAVKLSKPSSKSKELSDSAKTNSRIAKSSAKKKATEKSKAAGKEKASSKKRKQSTSIAVGLLSRNDEEPSKRQAIPNRDENATKEAPKLKATAIVPAAPEAAHQDKDILERLRAENPDGVRLSTYCSTFKGAKRERPAKEAAKQRPKVNQPSSPKKTTPEPSGAPVVQIVDGEIVLQESSLMVPGQRRSVQEVEAEYEDVVEEDAQLAVVQASYNSFVNRKGPQHWGVEETKHFYEALRQLGTDFCSMETLFENRTRKQLKRKYKAELTRNPQLVEMALHPNNQTEIDLSIFNVEVDPKAIEAAANEEPIPYEPTDVEPKESEANTVQKIGEEGAEEERRAATAKAAKQSFWSKYEEPREEQRQEPDISFPEPSMDDFFADKKGEKPSQTPETEMQAETEPTSISLVPKKLNAKSKRPKFRSAARKRR